MNFKTHLTDWLRNLIDNDDDDRPFPPTASAPVTDNRWFSWKRQEVAAG